VLGKKQTKNNNKKPIAIFDIYVINILIVIIITITLTTTAPPSSPPHTSAFGDTWGWGQ